MDMGGGGGQRGYVGAEQEGLVALDHDIGLGEVDFASAKALDLPALERDSGLVAVLDKILVLRLLVQGDGGAAGTGLLFCLLCHGRALYARIPVRPMPTGEFPCSPAAIRGKWLPL